MIIDGKELKLGIDYETIDTLISKAGLKKRESVYYRIKRLKELGCNIKTSYYDGGRAYWTREEADKILYLDHPKFRKAKED